MRFAILIILSLLFLLSCTISERKPQVKAYGSHGPDVYAKSYDLIREGSLLLQDGDLVFREGLEFSSQLVKNFSRTDKTYSHAGVVFFENGHPFVFHILPAEKPEEKMRKDSLQQFCNPRTNSGFAIVRYLLERSEVQRMQQQIMSWYDQGVKFDSLFSLNTDDRMYCSEMIYKGLKRATFDRISFSKTRPDEDMAVFCARLLKTEASGLSKKELIAIDNLLINPACQEIRRFQFSSY